MHPKAAVATAIPAAFAAGAARAAHRFPGKKERAMSEYFRDSEHFYEVLVPFFNSVKDHPEMGPVILGTGLVVKFEYFEPDAAITVDCPNAAVLRGETEIEPMLTMSMKADVAHRFWLGKLNLMAALTKREIVAKGPISAAMKLLPKIKGAFPIYKEHLQNIGMEEAIIE